MAESTIRLGNPDGEFAEVQVSDGAIHVQLETSPTIDIGDVTLLTGNATIGNIGTVTKGTVAISMGTVIVQSGTIQPLAGTVIVSSGTVNLVGTLATITHSMGTVTTTPAGTILAANANRLYAYIQNDGTAAVYISLGGSAAGNSGIRLNTSGAGEAYEMSKLKGNLFTGQITAISLAGTETILVTEGV